MHGISRVVLFSIAASLAGCAADAPRNQVQNDPKFLYIANVPFRKLGAFKADLLWIGDKKNSQFQPLFLPVFTKEITAHLSTEAFTDESRKAALDAGVKLGNAVGNAETTIKHEMEQSSKGTYKVFVVRNTADLVDGLNEEANRNRIDMLKYYDEPRIVVGTAVAFAQESTNKLANAGKINLAVPKAAVAPEIQLGASQDKTSTVKLSDGTTFAYELARMCFTEANNRIIVAIIDSDAPNVPDTHCPEGTYRSIKALIQEKAAKQAKVANK